MGTCAVTSANTVVETNQAVPTDVSLLVSQAQDGDREAMAGLYELYKKKVYSICARMTGDLAEAEDLTHEVFMQAFRKLSSFRGDSLFSTWLYRVAVNTVLMAFRKKRLPLLSLDESIAPDSSSPPREVHQDDSNLLGVVDRISLASAIAQLPPGCRMIFLLHDVEGYDHHEIAQILRCSVGNSKSQLHKARRKMRGLLFPNHEFLRQEAKCKVKPCRRDEEPGGPRDLPLSFMNSSTDPRRAERNSHP
jgi:RNA polymerase sigma-70 factor (ECF subfamily)